MEQLKGDALVLLLDIHPYLSNPVVTRALKELALRTEARGLQLVFTGHDIALPDELAPYASRFALEPMTLQRIKTLFSEELQAQRHRAGADLAGERATLESLMRHMVGLPEAAVRQMVRATLGDGRICTADLARVLAGKREVMGAAELLVFEQNLPAMDQVAGMKALKRWLLLRREAFLDGAASGLPPPRGVLLLGVQGAGKSLAAKAIAASWQVPLFRMDFGALFDKFQGESERKLREALRVADAMQPCVLWMDEVEKGLSSGSGDGDSGAGQRMLGTLLTWMAERRSSVFLVATANDIERLPPELMRKGRFDEIFFVDLPAAATREAIFAIHLGRHRIAATDARARRAGRRQRRLCRRRDRGCRAGGALRGACAGRGRLRRACAGRARAHPAAVGDARRGHRGAARLGARAHRRRGLSRPASGCRWPSADPSCRRQGPNRPAKAKGVAHD